MCGNTHDQAASKSGLVVQDVAELNALLARRSPRFGRARVGPLITDGMVCTDVSYLVCSCVGQLHVFAAVISII